MQFFQDTEFLKELIGWLTTVSLFTFVLSLLIIPWLVGKLPENIFIKYYDESEEGLVLTPYSLIILIVRNIAGILLLSAGIAMLFLPGQGILTIILALIFLSFPGKKKFLFQIITRPSVQRSLNWLRNKRKKPAFLWPNSY